MEITSAVFKNNKAIPLRYTGLGENINPPLELKDFPKETKSLVLWMEDADATPKPWIHWLVFNIPKDTALVQKGLIPAGGTEGLANNKTFGYEGPNQKYFHGTHHYYFKVYALDDFLDIPKESDFEIVKKKMHGHILDQAELLGICTSQ